MSLNNLADKLKEKLDEMFYFGPKGLIGIDIGASAIKFVEMSNITPGNYKINRYTSIPLPEGTIIEDEVHKEDEFIQALQEGLKELKSSFRFACIGFSGPNTLIKRLQVAGGDLQEIDDQVTWDSEQYLPFPPEDGNISFSIIGENQGGGVEVILGAAKRSLIYSMKDLVESSKIKVKIVELNASAMMNVFEIVMKDNLADKSWLFIDIGSQKTQVFIYKDGGLSFFKEIAIGGLTITEEIQRQMGVNFEEAESLKIYGDGSGNIPEEIVIIINQILETLFAELRRSVEFWTSSTSEDLFAGCMLTGGGAMIPGLQEAIGELFETDVQILNPFNAISYNAKNINEDKIEEMTYRGMAAIGLALRSLDK